MKILMAVQYLSWKGGMEEVILNQSNLLKKKGYSIELLTSEYSDNEANKTKDGIAINRLRSINITYRLFGIPFAIPLPTLANYKKLKNTLKNTQVVNVHGHPYLASFVFILMSKLLNKQVILTQHNTNIQSKSKVVNTVYFLFDRTIGKLNLHLSDKVIAVSNETRKYIETLTNEKEKIVVLYNGVDTERFTENQNKYQLREAFAIPKDAFVCLTIRRLTFKNGLVSFLNVAKLSDQTKTLFLIGGSGPDRQKIEEFIKEQNIRNVKLLGFVKDEDLPSYYALSDVFILPSIQGEGFPMVVLELFACGLPVIATKSGGHIEIIADGQTGYLVDINSHEQIHEKVEYLIKNKQLLQNMAKNCRTLVTSNLSWEQNITNFINIMNSMQLLSRSHEKSLSVKHRELELGSSTSFLHKSMLSKVNKQVIDATDTSK